MDTTRKPAVKIPVRKPVRLVIGSGVVAFISTLLGIGGGAFQVQVLSAWAPMRMKRSVGTSLALITAVVTVGMVVQVLTEPQDILWPEAGLMVAGALVGAPVGRWLLLIIPRQAFRYVFAVFLVVIAIRMFGLIPQATHLIGDTPQLDQPATIAFLLAAGFVAGLTSTLFGIGGGMVIVPALMLGFSDLSDNFAIARATSLIAIVPISAWATTLHALKGNLQLKELPILVPLCVISAVAGVFVAYQIHADYLTIFFAVLLLVMAAKVSLEKVRPVMPEDFEVKPAKPPDPGSKAD